MGTILLNIFAYSPYSLDRDTFTLSDIIMLESDFYVHGYPVSSDFWKTRGHFEGAFLYPGRRQLTRAIASQFSDLFQTDFSDSILLSGVDRRWRNFLQSLDLISLSFDKHREK